MEINISYFNGYYARQIFQKANFPGVTPLNEVRMNFRNRHPSSFRCRMYGSRKLYICARILWSDLTTILCM